MSRTMQLSIRAAACVLVSALCCAPVGADDRTIDGTGNNAGGAAGSQLMRLTTPSYGDGFSLPSGGDRPSPRLVSNVVADQTHSVPSANGLSSFVWAWGQFLDHDISLTPGHEPNEPFNIDVPTGDLHFDPDGLGGAIIPLNRSIYETNTGTTDPRQQLNQITSFIDGSTLYGSDATRAAALRTGVDGLLETSHGGKLMMYNTTGLDNASLPGQDPTTLYFSGDVRSNENAALTALHTLFMREHNRLAVEIKDANPLWTDEQIFQRARKIVGAQIQAITYNEFLPALGVELAPYTTYGAGVDASIANEFSTAAYRFGHSMLTPTILRLDQAGHEIDAGHLALRDAFFNAQVISADGIEPVLLGLVAQQQEEIDHYIIDDVRNFLFGPPGAGGLDLAALNMQRVRDHGLPGYVQMRDELSTLFGAGLGPITGFGDITSDATLAAKLEAAYVTVDKIDPWIGLLAEDHLPGTSIGATMSLILADQFTRLRDGDKYYFEYDPDISPLLAAQIGRTTLSDVIVANTWLGYFPADVFQAHPVPEPASAVLGTVALGALGVSVLRRRRA